MQSILAEYDRFCSCNPPTQYYNQILNTCQESCPTGTYTNTANKLCECCTGYFRSSSNTCATTPCPSPLFADPTIRRCVKNCPDGFISDVPSGECRCDGAGEYYNSIGTPTGTSPSSLCVTSCPSATTANPTTKRCECNSGTY